MTCLIRTKSKTMSSTMNFKNFKRLPEMKRIALTLLAGLLAVLMLLPTLASCGKKNVVPDDTSTEESAVTKPSGESDTSSADEEEKVVLPDVDYDRTIKFLVRNYDYYYNDIEVTEIDAKSSAVDEAVYNRNRAVEEQLGVTIQVDKGGDSNADTSQLNAILNNSCEYNVIANHGRSMSTYMTSGCLENWYDLEWVDLSKSWWSQGAIADFTVKDHLWMMTGDLSYQGIGATVVMVMNKKVCRDQEMDYPYEAVLDGTWTFETFYEMVRNANGSSATGTLDPKNGDLMGYMTSQWRGPMTVLYSAGLRAVDKDDDGNLTVSLNSDKTVMLYDDYARLLSEENCKIYMGGMPGDFYKTFANGNVLFMDTRLYDVSKLISEGFADYGILPWPKYDGSEDEYYAWVDAVANIFGVPTGQSEEDLEFISAVLEALSAEGQERVIPAFYEDTVQARYAQDPSSYQALELIRAGRVYDLASYLATDLKELSQVGYDIVGTSDMNYSNWWSKYRDTIQGRVDTLNAKFTALINEK